MHNLLDQPFTLCFETVSSKPAVPTRSTTLNFGVLLIFLSFSLSTISLSFVFEEALRGVVLNLEFVAMIYSFVMVVEASKQLAFFFKVNSIEHKFFKPLSFSENCSLEVLSRIFSNLVDFQCFVKSFAYKHLPIISSQQLWLASCD